MDINHPYGNSIVNSCKKKKNNDEFYTTYENIEKELIHYSEQLIGKIIYCPCDDYQISNFVKYFKNNFNILKLKKLISTSYDSTLKNNYLYIQTKEKNEIHKLKGTGDIFSDECIEIARKADIVITNPPFSLFSKFFQLIMSLEKKLLLLSNLNALMYKNIFPYVLSGEIVLGYNYGSMEFKVPDDENFKKSESTSKRAWRDESGQTWKSISNSIWMTNLKTDESKKYVMSAKEKYSPEKYHKFDNFNCLNIHYCKDIPTDYYELMAVPVSYLQYFDRNMFDLVGEANHGSDGYFDLFKPVFNGKEQFKKLVIRRKKEI